MAASKKLKYPKNKKSPDVHTEIRHLGVMIESVNDNVKLVAEQHGSIVGKLDSHTKILNEHTKILDGHTGVLNEHTKKLNAHTEMIGALAIDVSIIKQDVEFIKSSLKRKIDVEEFSMLEHRVALLEKRR